MSSLTLNELCRIFEKLDQNRDGQVSIDELKWLLDRTKVSTSLHDLESLSGKTTLKLDDFINLYQVITKSDISGDEKGDADSDSDLIKAFEVFDVNGDGFISTEELQSALSRLGLWDERNGQDVKTMINVYDVNLDGLLDFQEFKKMMLLTDS